MTTNSDRRAWIDRTDKDMASLEATPNQFGGVVVNPNALPEDAGRFRRRLADAMDDWADAGYKVAWLEIPIDKAALVGVAAEAGFTYHHAAENYAMMTLQIEKGAYIPPYATHYIGAGGVVISDDRQILVVSERHQIRPRIGPSYKLPGGALYQNEHLVEGVVREVLEETGVRTKFEALVCFRHWHGYRYDKSDIYFVCRLSPLSREITMQEEELEAALWMPVDEYLNADTVHLFNKTIVSAALNSEGVVPGFIEGYGDRKQFEFFLPSGVFPKGIDYEETP